MLPIKLALLTLAFTGVGSTATAAQSRLSLGVIGGASQYDLSGTGTAAFGGLRLDIESRGTRSLVFETGLHLFSYETQFDDRQDLWLPEISMQLQRLGQTVRPYLGVGAGYAFGSGESAATLSASVGSRFRLADRWSLRGELRVRSVDPWVGTLADWGLGLSRTL